MSLINKILNKEIKPQDVAFMTHQEMMPQKWEELIKMKSMRDQNKFEQKLEAATDTLLVENVIQNNVHIINYKLELQMKVSQHM
jgi:hypothetical protein